MGCSKVKMQRNSNLPEEIIVDILSRVQAKSLGRCRCVSKPWRALLCQPKFIRTHLHRSKVLAQESLIFISESQHSLHSAPLSSAHHLFDEITITPTKLSFADHTDSWTQVYASCDGLLLVGGNKRKKFVLNPVTKEISEVPPSPFAIDPQTSFIMYGLGYDSVSNDYKIVTLSHLRFDDEYDPECTEMFANVYSLKSSSWKRAESSPYYHAVGYITSGVFVNGSIHWLPSKNTDHTSAIVGFDLAKESFQEVPTPRLGDDGRFVFNNLVVLGGCLCMFHDSDTYIWMMKEYGVQESWTKFMIDDPRRPEIRPLCMLGKEQVVMVKDEEELVMYNLEEGTLKNMVVHGMVDDLHPKVTYVESLVSPHKVNETGRVIGHVWGSKYML